MKMKSVIKTNKDLKKNGYRIIRKLQRKQKERKRHTRLYLKIYMFILYCKGLTDIIELKYKGTDEFVSSFNRCEKFVKYLEQISVSKNKINKTYLAGFLKSYTKFFNGKFIKKGYPFFINQEILEKWNINCLMAYIATWGA